MGIAAGYAEAGNQIHMVKPIGMVKETVECLKVIARRPGSLCGLSGVVAVFNYGQSQASSWGLPRNRHLYFIVAATDHELWRSPDVL